MQLIGTIKLYYLSNETNSILIVIIFTFTFAITSQFISFLTQYTLVINFVT